MSTEDRTETATDDRTDDIAESSPASRDLPPAAQRALAEAEDRRRNAAETVLAPELGGRREGLEPVRYGDWEKKGLAIDF